MLIKTSVMAPMSRSRAGAAWTHEGKQAFCAINEMLFFISQTSEPEQDRKVNKYKEVQGFALRVFFAVVSSSRFCVCVALARKQFLASAFATSMSLFSMQAVFKLLLNFGMA
jgi:hypothetical protein